MARQLPNQFTRYQLTDQETISGQVLTTANYHVIQNIIADAAEQVLALKYDATKPLEFIQQEAELKGQIAVLRFLLDNSLSAQQVIKQEASSQA